MLKNRLYIVLNILILWCTTAEDTFAQATFTLTEAQITGQVDQNLSQASGTFAGSLLLGSLNYKSNTGTGNFVTTAGTSNLPLGVAYIRLLSIGTLSLGNVRPEIALTNQDQSLYDWLLNIGAGPLTLNFRLAMAGAAWNAGLYTSTNTLSFTSPATQTLTINVPSFITVNTPPATVILNVTSLASFRSGGITGTHTLDYSSSLASDVALRGNVANFAFSTALPKIVDPSPPANLAQAQLTIPTGGGSISLDVTDKIIGTNIAVQATNRRSITTQFSVGASDLKASFAQAGTYTLPLTYTLSKNTAAYGTALTATTTSSLQVVVPRLFEFIVPTASISLNVNSASAYRDGVTMASTPMLLSSTVPYNLTVRASGDFANGGGTTIPASTVTVEGISSETGVTAVALSVAPQTLISGASPVIDRSLNLQYKIPAAQTTNLLGKIAGVYQSTITFTCTAP